ncbi:butyrophilin-like protein 10 isoform X2 [Poecilia formosa]|uniref:butyrophilin-like protein 10 isoform X2 n=1 Tax=Poecilia formosa TaxID=48698 RepID=UPI000443925D|nr:PREDICTED: butyrophilin-like protein 10 isoform X2 [Poecilia formosa]
MEFLLRVSLCLLTFTGKTFGDEIQLFATEDSDIILPCSPIGKDDLTHQTFDWKRNDTQEVFLYDNGDQYKKKSGQHENFKNRVEFFQDQLQFGNASIRIKKTKLTDGGIYSCEFPKLQPPGQKFYMELVVGTCPKPTIKILQKENSGVKVQCVARGAYPEPKMELQNSDNVTIDSESTTISRNGNYSDIILQAVVTKEDSYHCIVEQEKICHQIYSEETLVLMPSEHTTKENPTGEMDVKGLAVGVCGLVVGVLGIIAAAFFYNKYRHNKKSFDEKDSKADGRPSSSSASNTVDKTGRSEHVPFNPCA